MKSNFIFLETAFPVLFQFGKQAETYLFSDSNSCLMKLGMIGETIVNLMFTYDKIPLPFDNTAVKRIDTLAQEGLLTQDLVDILHALRHYPAFKAGQLNLGELARVCNLSRTTVYKYLNLLEN